MSRDRAPQRLRQTIDAIKELILEQGLKPGDAMPTEAHLADLLGVSRANLREAIRTLATLDIIEVHHGTGMFVGPMSLRPLVEGLTFKGVVLPGRDFETLRQVVEVRQALDLAIERLPDDYRELISLRHYGELAYEEIAELKGMPLGTVKNKLFRARQALRDLLPKGTV